MKKQLSSALSAAVIGVLSPLAMVLPASAATQTFTSRSNVDYVTPSDRGKMSVDESWVSMIAPVDGDTVEFPATATYQNVNNDIAGLSLVKMLFNGARSGTSSKSFTVTGDGFTITESIEAVMTGSGGDHAVETDVTLGADATFKTSGSNTLSVGVGASGAAKGDGSGVVTTLALGTKKLTLDPSGGTISILGKVTGSGTIKKIGTGKVEFQVEAGSEKNATIEVSEGTFVANNSSGLNINVAGGTLKGTGTVGTVAMSSGTVAPGNSPGTLSTGNLTFTGGTHEAELGGKSDGQFDQLDVTGTVTLGSATTLSLSLVNSYAPAVNDSFVLIDNDGTDAVSGTFKDWADGGKKTLGSYTYQLNYDGGSGNDVVLLVTGTPSAPDTGVGSILNSPFATIAAAIAVAVAIAGYRFYDYKKAQK